MTQKQYNNKVRITLSALYSLLLTLIILSCTKSAGYKKKLDVPYHKLEPQTVEIVELNNMLFALDTDNFLEEYRALLPKYPEVFYENPSDEDINYMKEFVSDTFLMRINELVNETYPDIAVVADEVKDVYQHFKYYFPDWDAPRTFAYVAGVYYNRPINIERESVMIALDFYLSNKDLVYDRMGLPRYMSRRCRPFSLKRDLAEGFYYKCRGNSVNQKSVIAEMIEQGKKFYFIEALSPSSPDSVILGFSAPQMDWAADNEGQVWATVVGNNMLFSNNLDYRRLLFNDGPFTSAFGNEAPARLGDFLGLQIVRSFMSNNDETLTTLLKITDYQDVLERSRYKPRK